MNSEPQRTRVWVLIAFISLLFVSSLRFFEGQGSFVKAPGGQQDIQGVYPTSSSPKAPSLFLPQNDHLFLPFLRKGGEHFGVPQVPLDYSEDVETWWANHPYNPASPSYIPVGEIQSPEPVINVKTQFNGNIQAAVDALPATGGTLYFLAGSYDSFRVIAKNNVHFVGADQNSVFIRGGSIFGCPMSVSYQELDFQLSQNNPAALDCLRNRFHNYYFKNITFDGQNKTVSTDDQTPINEALYFRAVKDVLMENITIQNYGSPINDDWDGNTCENCANIVSHAWVDNIFCRSCVFRAYGLEAWYMDGSHGSGIINSVFDGNWRSSVVLNLVNNDFTEDLNRDGALQLNEQRVPMYTVYDGNTFTQQNYLAFTYQGARSLIKNNRYLADVHKFAYFEVRDDLPEYQYLGNVVEGNDVNTSSLFVINSGGSTVNQQGQYTVRDNTIASLGNLTPDEQGYNQFIQDFPVVVGPNTVQNNCVSGRLNGTTPGCTAAPAPTATPLPVSTPVPGTAQGSFPLGVFEDAVTLGQSSQFAAVINDLKAHHLDSIMLNGLQIEDANAFLSVSDPLNFDTYFPFDPFLSAAWWQSETASTLEDARKIIYPAVDAIKDHPSLKGYYIADEPAFDLKEKMTLAVQAFSERDPSRPAFPILIGIDRVGPLFDASKPGVMVIDVYPVGFDNAHCDFTMTGFGYYDLDFVSYIRQVVQSKPTITPLWVILQTHSFGQGGAYSLRQPTVEEIRAQHWMAIGEGAHGIFWFIYGSQQGWVGLKDNPDAFNEVSRLAERTNAVKDTLLGLHKAGDLFTVAGANQPYISTLANQNGTEYYVVAVNRGNCASAQNLSIASPSFNGELRDLETGKLYPLGSPIPFPPGDGKIFKFIEAGN